jgi:hypothetical protein
MSVLHYCIYLLGALYLVIGALIAWLALRPNCRICVHRGYCPNRVRRFVVPECARQEKSSEAPGLAPKQA